MSQMAKHKVRGYREVRDIVSIEIERSLREYIKSQGAKGETYSDIIRRLIKQK